MSKKHELDPEKHYLQIFFRPAGSDQIHPDMALHAGDSQAEVSEIFDRYAKSPRYCVTRAHFLGKSQALEPYAFGLADAPPSPSKWHLHLEYDQHQPTEPHVVHTTVCQPHNEHRQASASFDAYRQHIEDRGGRLLYAAITPPHGTRHKTIIIVSRPDE